MAGAPIGNQNAANGKKWKAAIERALAEKSRVLGKEALDECARVLIDQALAGEQWALQQLGDRFDGKPTQQTEISGPDGAAIPMQTVVNFVKPNDSGS